MPARTRRSVLWLWALPMLGAATAGEPARSTPPAAPTLTGVAVVELFTSQGCSSCPPADELLAQLQARHDADGVEVLALHVDYWDSLGWPDRFATPQASARQRGYARAMHQGSVYTPQMIVNGVTGFVGSDARAADEAIAAALATPAQVSVALRVSPCRDEAPAGAMRIDVTLTPVQGELPADVRVFGAIVQDGVVSKVLRGENAGRTLRHDGLVRVWGVVPVEHAGASLTLTPPNDLDRAHSRVVVFAQRTREGEPGPVLGAGRARLP